MEFIADFFNWIALMHDQLQDVVADLFTKLSAWFVIAVTHAKIEGAKFAWGVAQEIMNSLNLSGTIDQYWGMIDSKIMGTITYLKIPDALNLILNAHLTRYVLSMLRGF